MLSRSEKNLNIEKHYEYLLSLNSDGNAIGGLFSEPIRMSGLFWGLGSIKLMYNHLKSHEKNKIRKLEECIFEFIEGCKVFVNKEMIGYSQNIGLDPNIVSTHYAVLILLLINKLDKADTDKISKWISSLQNSDGSFNSDCNSETDCRFVYCALSCLTIMNKLETIDANKSRSYLLRCYNFDGAFGGNPSSESHAAYTYCCVASLAMLNSLDLVNVDKLAIWLSERQLFCGGFNGRPEKAPDVCYSWWIFSLLFHLNKTKYVDRDMLEEYIYCSQDETKGGFSDRPGNLPDVFHTFFGIAALSLINSELFVEVNPIFAIPNSFSPR
ncbi:geranylgeranyl transferase type-2 subunit beta [Cryptosporidium felis]|nr:geranylgeranyl transferase type-2 subunit beta [Cryptosporidium felis]